MRASLLGAWVLVAGCGLGHSQSLDDGGAGDDGGGGGGGGGHDAGLVSACGASVPTSGTPCNVPDLVCEFGSDPNAQCNTLAGCVEGKWEVQRSGGENCPTPAPGSKSCPATYDDVEEGTACPKQDLECGYGSQGYCVCTTPISGPPLLDASNSQMWYCDRPGAGCPTLRPRMGSACSKDGQYCDYGGCTMPGGSALRCESGRWVGGEIGCPL